MFYAEGMAGIATADDKTETLDNVRGRARYALSRFKSDPNAAAYAAALVSFLTTWTTIDQKEMTLDDAVTDGEAVAVSADVGLDKLVRQVSAAIFGGKKVDATLPLADLYFGGLPPSDFMRPMLGKQLVGMTSWPTKLDQATQPALLALAAASAVVVSAAATAATALTAAITARDVFRQGGERKSLFDLFNAACATAYGGLKTFAHSHPELDLPPGYSESFFQPSTTVSQPKTLSAANELVSRLEQKLGKAKTVQGDLAQKEAARVKLAAEHAKALADEAAAKQAVEDAKKAATTAKAAAKKTKPKKK